jgi:hypothetical protein
LAADVPEEQEHCTVDDAARRLEHRVVGWDPTPGIVSVWRSRWPRHGLAARSGDRALARDDVRFRVAVIAALDDLARRPVAPRARGLAPKR